MVFHKYLAPLLAAGLLLVPGVGTAREATPTAAANAPIDPARCTAPRRDVLAFAPVARQLTRQYIPPVEVPLTLPDGEAVDAETETLVRETVEQATACLNAGDLLRLTSLMTDARARAVILIGYGPGIQAARDGGDPAAYATTNEVLELFLDVTPLPDFIQSRLLDVRDIRELPDGRIAAVVVRTSIAAGQRSTVIIFKRADDGLLIAAEAPYLR